MFLTIFFYDFFGSIENDRSFIRFSQYVLLGHRSKIYSFIELSFKMLEPLQSSVAHFENLKGSDEDKKEFL